MQAKGASTWPATPGAPTIGTATAGIANCASVTFTAPGCTGYPAGVTGYRVISTPGCFSNTGASSPVVVSGLSSGTSYTFKAQATNSTGYGALSAASNSITATLQTCNTYTTPGTFTWVAPAGVTSVALLAVGAGGGGRNPCNGVTYWSGGGLAYKNNVTVTPLSSYTIVVGTGGVNGAGGQSYGVASSFYATGGSTAVGTYVGGCGGGNGGGRGNNGAGGAAGYTGAGGLGGCSGAGNAGAGGGGGGGGGGSVTNGGTCRRAYWGAGGGVGLYGQGSNGAAGSGGGTTGGGGGGGSSGCNGGNATNVFSPPVGGAYGGGGGTTVLQGGPFVCCNWSTTTYRYGTGGGGAFRIVWAGGSRGTPSFPSTNVGA